MRPICVMCKKRFTKYGAILISPPENPDELHQRVIKYHICSKCYDVLMEFIMGF